MRPQPPAPARGPRRRRTHAGFTLVEVLIAVLLGMIGLMGTLAIQQTVLASTQNANDAQIAMRLAQWTAEEVAAVTTMRPAPGMPQIDMFATLGIADGLPHANLDNTGGASTFLDAEGNRSPVATPRNRFERSITVTNLGASLPYHIVISVRYALDSGRPRQARLDLERRKDW